MSWLQRLYETYENCFETAKEDGFMIAPVAHTRKDVDVEISLNECGEIDDVDYVYGTDDADTIVQTTYWNNCLWGLSVNIKQYTEKYKQQLKEWAYFEKNNNKCLEAISKFVSNNDVLKILLKKYKLEEHIKAIKDSGKKNFKQEDIFIRWIVGNDKNNETWKNESLRNSWVKFQTKKVGEQKNNSENIALQNNAIGKYKCYITGSDECLIDNGKYPSILGGSKLITVAEQGSFVWDGRFENPEEALNIDVYTSQKALNTLEWLIAKKRKQAYRTNFPQVIVAFTSNGKSGNVDQVFGQDLVKGIKGFKIDFEQFEENENIIILEVDAITRNKGRASVTYYKELKWSKYINSIKNWHKKYFWEQFFNIKDNDDNKKYQYMFGTPSINTIANAYLYAKNKKFLNTIEDKEKKIKKKLIRDLMPSVLDGKNIPEYIEKHLIEKASNPVALINKNNDIQWKTILAIACAIYKGNYLYDKKEEGGWTMDETRDSLYGQLLALLDYGEERALCIQQKKDNANEDQDDTTDDKKNIRITNAKRYMRQFSLKPYSTWQFLLLKYNEAYMPRLKKNDPSLEKKIENTITAIMHKFQENNFDFENDAKLEGVFILAYYCQKYELKFNKSLETEIKQKENQNDYIK